MNEATTPRDRERPATLWLGDGRRPEFAATFDEVARRSESIACDGWRDADLPPRDLAPVLVVVAQGTAGEFSDADLLRLRRRYPTAAVVRIVGSWCEGELRTSPPPAAVKRYCWHHAAALLRVDFDRLEAGLRPEWGLPATATEEESLTSGGVVAAAHRAAIQVGIAASDPVVERWLFDFCTSYEFLRARLIGDSSLGGAAPDVVLWDVPISAASRESEARRLMNDAVPASVVALANYPRRDELAAWSDWGIGRVLGKPASNACLLAAIETTVARA